MQSWQSRVIETYFRIRRLMKSRPDHLDVAISRADNEALSSYFKSKIPFESEPVMIDETPAEWIIPAGVSTEATILFFHGGAYNSGSIHTHRSLVVNIAHASNARGLNVDYRLAPEYPFPAALEDARAAYDWLLEQGLEPGKIAIAGDSAGGGLTMALLLDLRDSGKPLPAAAVCLSPWLDLTCSGDTWTSNAGKDLLLDPGSIRDSARVYLGDIDPRTPLASPLFGELAGLPPLLIQVGSSEYLLSDSVSLAEKARDSGLDVTLEVYEGMQHEWHFAANIMPEGRAAIDAIGEFIQAQL
ncbi:MAG: alpha/beta hydrolase [Candidatus Marinimicrobia bacterium]|nr:alpha/beta hydrolase [Candidatus Neomarinimicrobiota bacterium]MCF7903940.1 alpha/beta hydrolase [Candidatus Neomarinimicrobiota bacterium]